MRTRSGIMLCGEHTMLIGERCIPSVESTSSHSFGELAPMESARPSQTTSRSVRVLSHRVGPLGASVWGCSRTGGERVRTAPEIESPARRNYTVRCICLLCIFRFSPEGVFGKAHRLASCSPETQSRQGTVPESTGLTIRRGEGLVKTSCEQTINNLFTLPLHQVTGRR
jgi:hypothetical protein